VILRLRRADDRRTCDVAVEATQAAFEAIAATLPLGSVGYENAVNERVASG
jgi:hypothetical protein